MPRKKSRVSKSCLWCKKQFEVIKKREKTAFYCSNHCKLKYYHKYKNPNRQSLRYPKVVGVCKTCGGDIIAKDRTFDKPNRMFCSLSCKAKDPDKKINITPKMRERMRKLGKATKGKKQSKKHIINRSKAISGKKHWNWKGGITKQQIKDRNNWRLKEWRRKVFQRDDYTCQDCGKRGTELNAHHIKSWVKYIKLRYILSNGITLCKKCHKKTDNYCGRATSI